MNEDNVAVMRRDSVGSRQPGTAARSVDALPVGSQPAANLANPLRLRRIDLPIRSRANIEQQVAVAAGRAHQQMNQLLERLDLRSRLIAPRAFGNRGA